MSKLKRKELSLLNNTDSDVGVLNPGYESDHSNAISECRQNVNRNTTSDITITTNTTIISNARSNVDNSINDNTKDKSPLSASSSMNSTFLADEPNNVDTEHYRDASVRRKEKQHRKKKKKRSKRLEDSSNLINEVPNRKRKNSETIHLGNSHYKIRHLTKYKNVDNEESDYASDADEYRRGAVSAIGNYNLGYSLSEESILEQNTTNRDYESLYRNSDQPVLYKYSFDSEDYIDDHRSNHRPTIPPFRSGTSELSSGILLAPAYLNSMQEFKRDLDEIKRKYSYSNHVPPAPRNSDASFTSPTKCECEWRKRDLGIVPPCYLCSYIDLPPPYKKYRFWNKLFKKKQSDKVCTDDMFQSRIPFYYPHVMELGDLSLDVSTMIRGPSTSREVTSDFNVENGTWTPCYAVNPNHQAIDTGGRRHPILSKISAHCCGYFVLKVLYSFVMSTILTVGLMSEAKLSVSQFLYSVFFIGILIFLPLILCLQLSFKTFVEDKCCSRRRGDDQSTEQDLEVDSSTSDRNNHIVAISNNNNNNDSNSNNNNTHGVIMSRNPMLYVI